MIMNFTDNNKLLEFEIFFNNINSINKKNYNNKINI